MATNTIKIRSGECAILPSNAIIVSAMTFATNPSVTSPDCQQLAVDVEDAIQPVVDANIIMAEATRKGDPTPNFEDVTLVAIRVNDIEYDIADIGFFSITKTQLQTAIDSTPLKGLVVVTSVYMPGNGQDESKRGYQRRINLKMPTYILKDFTLICFGSSVIGSQNGGVKLEFRAEAGSI